jgi:hypothetical protein
MKIALKWYFTPGLILMGACAGLGDNSAGDLREESATITIYVYNYAQVDHNLLMKAEKVASEVFRKAGVKSQWVNDPIRFENGQEKPAQEGPITLDYIWLMITPRGMADQFGLPRSAMGLAPGGGRDRQHVYIFYSNVEAVAWNLMIEQTEHLVRPHTTMDQILGHVIAHEIGHVLLNPESYAGGGIMREAWDLRDLEKAYQGCLLFTPQQAEVMRAEIARRSRLLEVPNVYWTRDIPQNTLGTPRNPAGGAGQ